MKKTWKRLCTGFLALATVVTALPTTPVHAESKQYWTESAERISELGYGMLFGSDVKKQFFQKRIKGRGYCDVGTSVISEFYTPLVPKGHDFLQEIGRLEEKRTASNES